MRVLWYAMLNLNFNRNNKLLYNFNKNNKFTSKGKLMDIPLIYASGTSLARGGTKTSYYDSVNVATCFFSPFSLSGTLMFYIALPKNAEFLTCLQLEFNPWRTLSVPDDHCTVMTCYWIPKWDVSETLIYKAFFKQGQTKRPKHDWA